MLAQVVKQQPANDQARANLGVALLKLGETASDFDGDVKCVFEFSPRLRDPGGNLPVSAAGNLTENDNHRILSGLAIKLGIAELSLGHPAAARYRFVDRARAPQGLVRVRAEERVRPELRFGGRALAGDRIEPPARPPRSEAHFDQAIGICKDLAHRFPNDTSFQGDLSVVYGDYGEVLARQGKDAEAEAAFRRSLEHANPSRPPPQRRIRATGARPRQRTPGCIRLARGQSRRGSSPGAPALEIRREAADLEPRNVPYQVVLAVVLAHSESRTEPPSKPKSSFQTAGGYRPALLLPRRDASPRSPDWRPRRRPPPPERIAYAGSPPRGGQKRLPRCHRLADGSRLCAVPADPAFQVLFADR